MGRPVNEHRTQIDLIAREVDQLLPSGCLALRVHYVAQAIAHGLLGGIVGDKLGRERVASCGKRDETIPD